MSLITYSFWAVHLNKRPRLNGISRPPNACIKRYNKWGSIEILKRCEESIYGHLVLEPPKPLFHFPPGPHLPFSLLPLQLTTLFYETETDRCYLCLYVDAELKAPRTRRKKEDPKCRTSPQFFRCQSPSISATMGLTLRLTIFRSFSSFLFVLFCSLCVRKKSFSDSEQFVSSSKTRC
jgi:hypothetical protein